MVSGNPPLTVGFVDQSVNLPTTWLWDFGDGATSTAQSPAHIYTVVGNYTVKLTVTNALGTNSITRTNFVTIGNPADPARIPVPNFTYTPNHGEDPLSVTFTDTSTNNPTSWSWGFGDGTSSLSKNPTHVYTNAGTYDVKLIVRNAAGGDVIQKNNIITTTDPIVPIVPPPVVIPPPSDPTQPPVTPPGPVNPVSLFAQTTPHISTIVRTHIVQFDYLSNSYPTKTQSGADWDPSTGDWFEAQEDTSNHNMYVHRFDRSGNHISSMLCINGGHGSAIAVQRSGSKVYIWFNWNDGGAHFCRIAYTAANQHLSDAQIIDQGESSDTYCCPALDTANNLAAIRFVSGGDDHYKVVRLSDMLAGNPTRLGPVINAGSNGANIFQGMAMHKNSVFKISGPASSKSDYRAGSVKPVYVWEWDWRTGKLLSKKNVATAAVYSGDITMSSEPEGLSVINRNNYPVLTALFKRGSGVSGDSDRRRMRVVGLTRLAP